MLNINRARLGIGVFWAAGLMAIYAAQPARDTVVINHWANGHMMDPPLLPGMAAIFNSAGHRTASGDLIEVRPYVANSAVIASGLIGQVDPTIESVLCEATGCLPPWWLPPPTIVTPASDHSFYDINHAAKQTIVQSADAASLARAWVGIVTLWDTANCLGWPRKQVGFADIVALQLGQMTWDCPNPRPEWARPRLVFTNPRSSTTGRSVLTTLLTIPYPKVPEQVTIEDVNRPAVAEYIRSFQSAVDHYEPDTLMMNKYIHSNQVGTFFFIAEDNLVKLYIGKISDGQGGYLPSINRQLVMVYPSEGATQHNHAAAIALGSWVSPQQQEGARRWIAFLREEAQQQTFMDWGFRPGTDLPLQCPVCPANGIDPAGPSAVLNLSGFQPGVRNELVRIWGNPGPAAAISD